MHVLALLLVLAPAVCAGQALQLAASAVAPSPALQQASSVITAQASGADVPSPHSLAAATGSVMVINGNLYQASTCSGTAASSFENAAFEQGVCSSANGGTSGKATCDTDNKQYTFALYTDSNCQTSMVSFGGPSYKQRARQQAMHMHAGAIACPLCPHDHTLAVRYESPC